MDNILILCNIKSCASANNIYILINNIELTISIKLFSIFLILHKDYLLEFIYRKNVVNDYAMNIYCFI